MIYFIILLFIASLAFFYDFTNLKGGERFFYAISWLIFVLLFGLRYRVGGDTLNYMLVYDSMPSFDQLATYGYRIGKLQPLWLILVAVSKSIYSDFVTLQILHALIVNTIIFRFIKSNTKYYFTGILLYFLYYSFYFNMEIMRESLAVSFFLLSLKSFNARKWLNYYLLITISFLFHYSAIILFVLPLFHSFRLTSKTFILLILYFVLGLFIEPYFINILDYLPLSDGLMVSLSNHLDYKFTVLGIISILLLKIFFPSFVYFFSKKIFKIQSNYYVFLAFYIVIACSVSYFSIFFRFMNYFIPVLFLFLTEMIHSLFRQNGTIRLRLIAVTFSFIMLSAIFLTPYCRDTSEFAAGTRWFNFWVPYVSVFNKKLDTDRERLHKAQNYLKYKTKEIE